MASKRTSMIQDLEPGDANAELERIRQNFRPSVIITPAEVPGMKSLATEKLETDVAGLLFSFVSQSF